MAESAAKTIGVVGLGNMGGAIVRGLLASGHPAELIHGFDVDDGRAASLGIRSCESVSDLAGRADVIVLAVKPWLIEGVARGVAAAKGTAVVLSVAAGLSTESLLRAAPELRGRLVRAMPNTAAAVRRSSTALFADASAEPRARAAAESVFGAIGSTAWIPREELMHTATAIVGSAPAFLYVFAEALEDAAVLEGMGRTEARRMLGTMIEGAGALLSAHQGSPAALKDGVTSPGGTTIRGVAALEEGGYRAALIAAIRETVARSREMG
jgi:pyrroline-5-carboxylate reductase